MSRDTIQDIIETEKQIYQALQNEKQKASRWVADQKKKIDADLQEQLAAFKVNGCRYQDAVKKEAQMISDQQIASAKKQIKQIENIPEGVLKKIIQKYLPSILPET